MRAVFVALRQWELQTPVYNAAAELQIRQNLRVEFLIQNSHNCELSIVNYEFKFSTFNSHNCPLSIVNCQFIIIFLNFIFRKS